MSNAVWPVLPGLAWNVTRTPQWNTRVQKSVGGMELRASYYSQPIRRYQLTYDVLRASTALQELQSLAGFFHARQGSYDSFLYDDPTDDSVSAHGFGVGDGTTTTFQLQRTLAGPRNADGISGTLSVPTTPRTNYALWTEQFDNAAWSAGNVTVVANTAVAPDGNATADRLTPTAVSGAITGGTPLFTMLQTVLYSIWLRADTPHTATIKVQDSVTVNGASLDVAVTTAWQRFSVPMTFAATDTGQAQLVIFPGQFGGGSGAAFALYAWGAQLEVGVTTATPYISNNSGAAKTANPAYWPAAADGFEPVYNPKAGPTLYRQDWQGNQLLYRTARTNLFPASEPQVANLSTNVGTPLPANATLVVPGYATVNAIQFPATISATQATYESLTVTAGLPYSASVIVQMSDNSQPALGLSTTTGDFCIILSGNTISSGTVAYQPLGGNVWRVTVSGYAPAGVNANTGIAKYTTQSTKGLTWSCLQVEQSSVATAYIKTSGSAVTVTDYTLANGLVTFASAPLAGAALTWAGGYYWRCRFEKDLQEFNNFLYQLWEAKSVAFVTVKGS